MILRAFLAFLLIASPAMAHDWPDACMHEIPMPPERYSLPLDYSPTIRIVDFWDVDKTARQGIWAAPCGAFRGRIWECAAARSCLLPAVDDWNVSLLFQQCLFFHCRGHLEGWSGRHEDAQ